MWKEIPLCTIARAFSYNTPCYNGYFRLLYLVAVFIVRTSEALEGNSSVYYCPGLFL